MELPFPTKQARISVCRSVPKARIEGADRRGEVRRQGFRSPQIRTGKESLMERESRRDEIPVEEFEQRRCDMGKWRDLSGVRIPCIGDAVEIEQRRISNKEVGEIMRFVVWFAAGERLCVQEIEVERGAANRDRARWSSCREKSNEGKGRSCDFYLLGNFWRRRLSKCWREFEEWDEFEERRAPQQFRKAPLILLQFDGFARKIRERRVQRSLPSFEGVACGLDRRLTGGVSLDDAKTEENSLLPEGSGFENLNEKRVHLLRLQPWVCVLYNVSFNGEEEREDI